MLKKLTIHNLKVDLLHPIQKILTHFGENLPEVNEDVIYRHSTLITQKMIPISDIYCQERRILFVAGNRTLSANLTTHNGVTEINSTSLLITPKKYSTHKKGDYNE
jgi:hypothetical protein